jgi:hypothetical protein
MNPEELDERSAALLAELEALPATKPPTEFTGRGFEIIGDPTGKCGGQMQYRNGKFRGIQCVSQPILTAARGKRRIPTLADQVAWFILSRERANSVAAANSDDPEHQRTEASERREAHLFAQEITDLIMNGRFLAFSKRVERAISTIKKEQEEEDVRRKKEEELRKKLAEQPDYEDDEALVTLREKEDGYTAALFLVASQCRHPAEVTVSAIVDFLRGDPRFCKKYQIDRTMKDQRGVRQGLETIGFGWIPDGRGKGRPTSRKSAK